MAGMFDKEIYKRPYNRPNEKWVCGRASEGRPCPHGPSRGGRCTVGYECTPAQIGERWVCTRPEQYGGPCDSPALENPSFGPTVQDGKGVCCRRVQCTPVRSMRARRGVTSVVICLLLVGAGLVAIGGPWRHTIMSPGALTVQHQGASMASLETMQHGTLAAAGNGGGGESESCHICHTTLDEGLKGILASALRGEDATPQSQQCLACHEGDLGEKALFTHAMDPAAMSALTESAASEPFDASRPLSLMLASLSPGVKTSAEGKLACAACHREHNGPLFDLTRLGNNQCQTCHTKQFRSFGNGHPEFSTMATSAGYDYPYRRRTRIVFDHESHASKHFQDPANMAHAPADCRSCHEIEDGSQTTQLKSFEQMCAACHTGNITSARDEWIHVFGFPSLETDVYDILENELEIPGIPRTTRKSFSPIMMLLLSGMSVGDDAAWETFRADLETVLEFDGDLSGIAFDDDPEILGRLYTGLKTIYENAMDEEAGGLRAACLELMERVRGAALDSQTFDAMFGFPEPGATAAKVLENVGRRDIVETSGWHVRESGFRVDRDSWKGLIGSLEPYAALADAVDGGDAGRYEGLVDLFSSASEFKDWFDAHFQVAGDEWMLLETGKEAKSKDWKALIAGFVGGGDDDEEGDSDEGDGEDADEDADDATDGESDEETESDGDGGGDGDLSEAGDAFVAWFSSMSKVQRWMQDNLDMTGSSWTLRAPRSLYYRPIQHADPFMTEWLNVTAKLYNTSRAAALVFDELSGRHSGSAIGSCMKCHSIDAEQDMSGEPVVRVNWKAQPRKRDFTKFNHSPHLKLMNCAECHRAPWIGEMDKLVQVAKAASAEEETPSAAETAEPQEDAPATEEAADGGEAAPEPEVTIGYLDSFRAEDGSLEIGVDFTNDHRGAGAPVFASNFAPVAKDDCARCHQPSKAGDSCVVCHNYHIEGVNRAAGVRSLSALLPADLIAAAPEAEEAAAEAAEAEEEEAEEGEAEKAQP